MIFNRTRRSVKTNGYNSSLAYQQHLAAKLNLYGKNRELAFADAIGSDTIELFKSQGDAHVVMLRHHGLDDGMSVYDLGCGCGRTAEALQRAGWHGRYTGADVVEGFVSELKRRCPAFDAYVHREPSILAATDSLDMIFHWSVFTHISPEECFLYLEDSFRALKPKGKLVFSFMELADPRHLAHFESRCDRLRDKLDLPLLDTFLHRDWISAWTQKLGFKELRFTDGQNSVDHPPAWQTVAAMQKPGV